MSGGSTDLTALLARLRGGDAEAADRVVSALYAELHQIAARSMWLKTRLEPVARG
jgi:hypothetical protein